MNATKNTPKSPPGPVMLLRAGTPQHDAGLCALLIMELTDDCTPQGRRRRSELAEDFSRANIVHSEVVCLAA